MEAAQELAGLVADTLAYLDAFGAAGGTVVAPSAGRIGRAPEPLRPAAVVAPVARSSPPRAAPTPGVAPPSRPAPQPAPVESPASLLGKWAALADPASRLADLLAGLPEVCPECGLGPARGEGNARARLALVAGAMTGASAEMFDKMLVRVLSLERGDLYSAPLRPCRTCRAAVARQVAIVRPHAVLVMGGDGERGRWRDWDGIPMLTTWHPDELVAEPANKRAALAHLQSLVARI